MRISATRSIGWRVAGAALVVVASFGLGNLPASAAPPPGMTGSISGRVVDQQLMPLAGICVGVENGPGATTDSLGDYSVTGVLAGDAKVQFSDCNSTPIYLTQWYLGKADSSGADPVVVTDGQDTPLSDVLMQPGVSVQGNVTDSQGAPLSGISVNVNPTTNGPSAGVQTDGNGDYATGPLPSGQYKVAFTDSSSPVAWGPAYWNQKPSYDTADVLQLNTADGTVHGGIDAQLSAAATVEGTVLGVGGAPASGICVDVDVPDRHGGWDDIQGTTTASDGTYSVSGLPATDVRVRFRGCGPSSPYIDQWFDTQGDFNSSTPIVLTPGQDRTGVDAQLTQGIAVAGRVTDGDGNPLGNISVNVNPTDQGSSASTQTAPDGTYTTNALPPGTYRVGFSDPASPPTWATQYWSDKFTQDSSDVVTLAPSDGVAHGGIDATLAAGATVSGTVTTPGGAPAAGICVNVAVKTSDDFQHVGDTTTASDGTYSVGGLPATAVAVRFDDCNHTGPYVTQWWPNQLDAAGAQTITLAAGDPHPGVDAQLAAAAEITGTVTGTNGNPAVGICVQATTATFFGGLTQTDNTGHYAIDLSRPGGYKVQFVDCNDNPTYAGQWWNGATSATAQIVQLAAGQVVGGVDAALVAGATGTVTGHVVNAAGTPMTNVCVIAFLPNQFARATQVGSDGSYEIDNVPSGTYALAFLGCNSNPNGDPSPVITVPGTSITYAGVWWKSAPVDLQNGGDGGPDPIAQGATLVDVAPGQAASGYDHCFGCGAIVITGITGGHGSLTVSFTTPGFSTPSSTAGTLAVPVTYTVACTSTTGGIAGSATGTGSPITVSGLTPGASYTCTVTASDGSTTAGTSAASIVVVASAAGTVTPTTPGDTPATTAANGAPATGATVAGTLPRTGSGDAGALVRIAIMLLAIGFGLSLVTTRRRRTVIERS